MIGNSRKIDGASYFLDQLILDYWELDTVDLSNLKIEHIIFCASSPSQFNQYDTHPVNVGSEVANFDLFVKKIARIPSLKQFIFLSSAGSLYDSNQIVTENSKLNISTPYAILKHESENILIDAAVKYNFGLKILRISNIYGPTTSLKIRGGFLNTLIYCAFNSKPFRLDINCKKIKKNFVYVNDLANIVESFVSNLIDNQIVINVADSNSYTLYEVFSIAEKVLKTYNLDIDYHLEELNYIGNHNHVYDINLLSEYFPIYQSTSIDRGIELTLKSLNT